MTKIDLSTFGSITIDGKTFNHDIYILPSGKVEEKEGGHNFTKEQAEYVLEENPEVVVIGKGISGMANLSSDARALLEEKEVEVFEVNTGSELKEKFNQLSEIKRVAAIIHTTC